MRTDRMSMDTAGALRAGDLSRGRPRAPKTTPHPLHVFDLGTAPYLPVQELQRRLREAVADGRSSGVLLLLEHEPVITLGTRAGAADIRDPRAKSALQMSTDAAPGAGAAVAGCGETSDGGAEEGAAAHSDRRGIDVVRSERGGQATLHAPGQLVSYLIVPIPGHDLSRYVRDLEEVLVMLLRGLDITATRRRGAPGLYVGGEKIASVGLRCSRWTASHGTSLNVDVDLSLFDLIVSCGEPDLRQTSVAALLDGHPSMPGIKRAYVEAAGEVFGWDLLPSKVVAYEQVETELGL